MWLVARLVLVMGDKAGCPWNNKASTTSSLLNKKQASFKCMQIAQRKPALQKVRTRDVHKGRTHTWNGPDVTVNKQKPSNEGLRNLTWRMRTQSAILNGPRDLRASNGRNKLDRSSPTDPSRNEPILCNYLHGKKNILKGGVRPLEGQQKVAQMATDSLIDRETHRTPTYI